MGMYRKETPRRRLKLAAWRRPILAVLISLAAVPFLLQVPAAVQTGIGLLYDLEVEHAVALGAGTSYEDTGRITTKWGNDGNADYAYLELGDAGLKQYGGYFWEVAREHSGTSSLAYWYISSGTLVWGGNLGGGEDGGITTFFWGNFSARSTAEDPLDAIVAYYEGHIIHRSARATCVGGDDPGSGCVVDADCTGGGTCTGAADPAYQLQNASNGTDPAFNITGAGGFEFYPENCGSPGGCSVDTELGRLDAGLWGGSNGTELVSDGCVWVNGSSGRRWCSGSGAPASADCDSSAERGDVYTNTADSSSTLYVCQGDGAGGQSWTVK